MDRFSTALEVKDFSEGGETYTVAGYASIFGNKDLDDDIIEKGAFTETLKSREPLLLYGHDMGAPPIGKLTEVYEDAKGLAFKAELPKDDDFVKGRIAPQLRIGAIKGVSIGFRIKDREHRKDGVRVIKTAELFEISLVNIPANPLASVTGFKSMGVSDYADLPLADRGRKFDADEALARIKEFAGVSDESNTTFRQAFLFCDPDNSDDPSSCKFLIADVIDGRLTAVPSAIYKAATALMKCKPSEIKSDTRDALQGHLDRYYARLELASSTKALSKGEWEALEDGEREVRLRSLGITGGLAKMFVSGLRDADRTPRDAGLDAELRKSLSAIQQLAKGLSNGRHDADL